MNTVNIGWRGLRRAGLDVGVRVGALMWLAGGAAAQSVASPNAPAGMPSGTQAPAGAFREGQQDHLRRGDERLEQRRRQSSPVPDVRLPAPAPAPQAPAMEPAGPDLPCFPINQVSLEGEVAGFEWLLPLLTPPMEACIGTRGIARLIDLAQNELIARGFVTTRVVTPPQNLDAGHLRFHLIPGRISALRLLEPSAERASWGMALPAAEGDLLNLRDIEQALENFRRVPTVEADIQIVPGARPGDSELHLRWSQASPVRLSFTLDDSGSPSTGRYQGNATLSYDNLWQLNDLFYVTLGRDLGGGDSGYRGTRNASVHYSVPVGYWSLSVDIGRHSYHQTTAGAVSDYLYSGRSVQRSLTLSRLVHRDTLAKTHVSLGAFFRQSEAFVDDTSLRPQNRRTGGWEMRLDHSRQWGRGQLDAHVSFKRGTGAFGAQRAPEELFNEGTSRFAFVTAGISWNQPLDWGLAGLQWSSSWRGQTERTPLTSQDRFAIGGRHSVRGFDGVLNLAAERGWWWRNELSTALGSTGHRVYAGMDHGEVGGPSAAWLLGRRLSGAVVGLRGNWSSLSYDVFWAKPLYMPDGFRTSSSTAGFFLSAAF